MGRTPSEPEVPGQIPQTPRGGGSAIEAGKVSAHRADPVLKLLQKKPVAHEADGKFVEDERLTVGGVFPSV